MNQNFNMADKLVFVQWFKIYLEITLLKK